MAEDAATTSAQTIGAQLQPGSSLGPYRIERQIGRGGMSTVYAATHVPLDRVVALKVLLPSLTGDPAFVERFLSEARAAARLDYPHIVPIYDSGEIDGVNYIAMKLLNGRDLRSVLVQRRAEAQPGLPLPRAISIASQAAGALEYAHQHRVVHRDVKPANIYVDANDRATLVDFGIARALDRASTTLTGTVLGTPAYMSPEQVRGQPADSRSDIYALGVVLYEMLAGSPPFRGDARSVMRAQIESAPPPLSTIRAGVPPGVDEIVQRALAKEPAQRYQSAGALARALASAAGGQLGSRALTGDEATSASGGTGSASFTGPRTGAQSLAGSATPHIELAASTGRSRLRRLLPWLVAGPTAITALVAVLAWALAAGPLAYADGRLSVNTDPGGANVMVDGANLGVTPLSAISLAPGAHQLQLDKPGYIQVKRTETLRARQTDRVTATLTALPAADQLEVQQAVVGKDISAGPNGQIKVGTEVTSVQIEQQFGLVVTLAAKIPQQQDITFRYQIALLDPSGRRLASSPLSAGTIAKGDIAGRSFAFTFSFHPNSDGTIPIGKYQLEFLVGNQVMVTQPITLVQ